MRTTIVIDDDLLDAAQEYAGIKEKSALVKLALTSYVEAEAARRLARLGGSDPQATRTPRRRADPA
jgi:Arc/MetJ family transcription regulator